MRPDPEDRIVRFGTFEVDLQEGRFIKAGVRIRLQEQPFQILALLLSRPGELVTREEIRQKLWSRNTFVEFDDALNTAVRKLRAALNDSAHNPRFLETVPRRGYRFIAPVALPAEPRSVVPNQAPKESSAVTSIPTSETRQPQALSLAERLRNARRNRYAWLAATLIVVGAAVGGFWYHRRPRFQITSRDTIVLADFVNTTGETVFDDALKQGLNVGLEQSPIIQILSDERSTAVLKQMSHSADESMTGRVAIEVCKRTGSKVIVQGSISSLGTAYLIGLTATRCDNGEYIAHEQIEAKRKEDVIGALGNATSQLRSRLGESLPSIQKYESPLEQATTPSLEALQAYTQGTRTAHERGDQDALPYLQRAVKLDPDFARAYASLGASYMALEQPTLAIPNNRKAFELRNRVSEGERLYIEGMYYLNVTGELEKAVQVFREHAHVFPNDADAHGWLGFAYYALGQWDKSEAQCRESVRLNPDDGYMANILMDDYIVLNRLDDAKAVYELSRARKLQNGFPDSDMYLVAFAKGDAKGMQQYFDAAMGKPGIEDVLLSMQSDIEAYNGHLRKARESSQRAVESARKNDARETAAFWQAYAALHEAEFGNAAEASKQAEAALSLAPGRDVRVLAAMAMARVGNATETTKLVNRLNEEFPLDTMVQSNVFPTIRAMLALSQGQGEQALKPLEKSYGYELAVPQVFMNTQPALYPIYVRGQAYLKIGQGPLAVAEFQKMIGFFWMSYPLGALSRLQLGRAYAMSGDKAKAQSAYQDFFTLWKDADPDIPILIAAKAEYAKLK
ncbi:MAG: winged helix-turn-helix domain-containing protein [Candidatus Acidiferrales bacterium]